MEDMLSMDGGDVSLLPIVKNFKEKYGTDRNT